MYTPFTQTELEARLRKIKHVALDMDGTIYLGATIFPWTIEFLQNLKANGIGYSFLTNNPSKSLADYLHKLENMGIHATPDEMYTTAVAMVDFLKSKHPEIKRLFVLGTPSTQSQFLDAGFVLTQDDAEDVPDAIVLAFDMTLEYSRLCRAAWWVSQGKPYFATNPDKVCPTNLPTVLVDTGSLRACIAEATGRMPDVTLGKPDPEMLSGILEKHGLQRDEVAMVGDRIYTDIAMARNAGVLGVLVLSGETTLETALSSNPQPDLTVENIAELGQLLLAKR